MKMNQNCIIYAQILYTFVSSILSEGTKKPFIFNPYTLDIYDLESIASSTYDDVFAVACPAEHPDELYFNEHTSLDRKALFVRTFLKKNDPKLLEYGCKERYYMAVVYHKVKNYGRLLEFGYEIYYSSYQMHKGVIHYQVDFVFGRAEEVNSRPKRFYQALFKDFLPLIGKRFVWIPKVQFRYTRSEWNVKWISYYMNLKTHQLRVFCTNFNLGLRLYHLNKRQGQTPDDFYSTKNQASIFSQLQLPNSVDGTCKSQNQCVEEYHLVAPYRFQASVSEPAIECSHLTSIPIWYERTKELLDYTEKFIIAFSQVVGNKVEVLTGIYEELTFLPKNQKKPKPTPIYLDWKKKRLSVPRIIYKIVSSKTDDCDPKKSQCQNDVAIIIHNEPHMSSQNKICVDRCEQWGWESIQNLSTTDKWNYNPLNKHRFIYCCELHETLQKMLAFRKKPVKNGYLSLKCVQNYKPRDDSQKPSVCPDIQTKVENKMNEIFKPKL